MRTKRRYLAFEIIGPTKPDRDTVVNHIVRSHLRFAGEKLFALSSPWLISYDQDSGRGILRSNLAGVDDLRAAMVLTEEIDGRRAIMHTLGVSGTLRSCEDRFIRKSKPNVLEEAEKRNGEEDPGRQRRLALLRAASPGSRFSFSHREFKLKQVFADGRVDLKDDEGSFGFTILDLLGPSLSDEV